MRHPPLEICHLLTFISVEFKSNCNQTNLYFYTIKQHKMTFTATHFSFSAGLPQGPSQHEVPPAYQALLLPSQRHPAGAGFEKTEEGLAEELDIRLHLDSLPLPRSVRLSEYVIPSDGIRWDIIDSSISKLLGEEAYLWNTVGHSLAVLQFFSVLLIS